MKKKIISFFIIFILLICNFLPIFTYKVYADEDYSAGGTGTGVSIPQNAGRICERNGSENEARNCYKIGTSGVRIKMYKVKNKSEKYYTHSGNGYESAGNYNALFDGSLNKKNTSNIENVGDGRILDLWYFDGDDKANTFFTYTFGGSKQTALVYFKNKKMRQDYDDLSVNRQYFQRNISAVTNRYYAYCKMPEKDEAYATTRGGLTNGNYSGKNDNVRACVVNSGFLNNSSLKPKVITMTDYLSDASRSTTDPSVEVLKFQSITKFFGDKNILRDFVWTDSNTGQYPESNNYLNARIPNSTEKIYTRIKNKPAYITKLIKYFTQTRDSTGKYVDNDTKYNEVINTIINYESSGNGPMYVFQFEPLVTWSNFYTDTTSLSKGIKNYTFFGTVTELYLIFGAGNTYYLIHRLSPEQRRAMGISGFSQAKQEAHFIKIPGTNIESHAFNSYNANCDASNIAGVGNSKWQHCDVRNGSSCGISSNYNDHDYLYQHSTSCTSFFSVANVGIYGWTDYFPTELDNHVPLVAVNDEGNRNGLSLYGTMVKYPNKTLGAAFIYIKKALLPPVKDCETEAAKVIHDVPEASTTYATFRSKLRSSTYLGATEYGNQFKDNNSTEQKVNGHNAKTMGILPTTPKYCSNYTCDQLLSMLPNDSTYLTRLEKLRTKVPYYSNYEFLDANFINSLYGTSADIDVSVVKRYAACKGSNKCLIDPQIVSCNVSSNTKTLTFMDKGNWDDCLSKGIAYNYRSDTDKVKAQGSFDSTYSAAGATADSDRAYCQESVSITLPTNNSLAKSGTVLKWGIDSNKFKDKFGEMTVTRECRNVKRNYDNMKWTKEITDPDHGTKFNIQYRQAIPGSSGGTYTNSIIKTDASLVWKYINVNGTNIDSISAAGKVTGVTANSVLRMTAYYDIVYGNDLHWYSDKSDSYKNKTETESDTSSAKYIEIGYGLPTSFLTPSKLKYNSSTYKYEKTEYGDFTYKDEDYKTTLLPSSYNNIGRIAVVIKGIGSYDTTLHKHHFDNYVGEAVKDDKYTSFGTGYGNGTGQHDGVYYSCKYTLDNELFGNECEGEDIPEYCKPSGGGGEGSPKGLDVAFRTIELVTRNASNKLSEVKKAFPGKQGSGREIGRNWKEYLYASPSQSYTNDTIYADKLNLLGNDIYNKTPIYSIKLTSGVIQKIREYNKTAKDEGFDPYSSFPDNLYSGSNGYVGYICHKEDTDEFAFCASHFLTYLISEEGLDIKCYKDSTTLLSDSDKISTTNRASFGACNQKWFE